MAQLMVVTSVVLLAFCGSTLASPVNNTTDDPECSTTDDCASERTCIQHKCVDPCLDICGPNTVCHVVNFTPMCSCKDGFTGHPFTGCNSEYECSTDGQCPLDRKCINQQCVDPCEEACGVNSACRVVNHRQVCACKEGFSWNPLKGCQPQSLPECTSNAHCADDRSCLNQKCVDPCLDVCGNNTVCIVSNHYPACACSPGYTGNPFDECKPQCVFSFSKKPPAKSEKKFLVVDIPLAWLQARKHCLSLNMDLVSIHSQEEHNRVVQEVRNSGIQGDLWTSGISFQGMYTWVSSGTLGFPYTNWKADHPDSSYYCVDLRSAYNYLWGTYSCSTTQRFICEYYDI